MTTSQTALPNLVFSSIIWQSSMFLCRFLKQLDTEETMEEVAEKQKKTKCRAQPIFRATQKQQAQHSYANKAAQRAATKARPCWSSDESRRNKCRREERMLRAKRASSPEREIPKKHNPGNDTKTRVLDCHPIVQPEKESKNPYGGVPQSLRLRSAPAPAFLFPP